MVIGSVTTASIVSLQMKVVWVKKRRVSGEELRVRVEMPVGLP